MSRLLTSFLMATLFGFGLSVSEMINPARVLGFLDLAGDWDPTLLLVMAGALAVTVPVFPIILRRRAPVLEEQFSLPVKTKIDARLMTGAALFGAGWGLAGFCPGPALAALASASPAVFLFVASMIAGQWVVSWREARDPQSPL
jgi:uncharacterized membrane protein YedE/YeeE